MHDSVVCGAHHASSLGMDGWHALLLSMQVLAPPSHIHTMIARLTYSYKPLCFLRAGWLARRA